LSIKISTKFGVLALVIENINRFKAKINGATTIVTFIKFVDSKSISNIIVNILNLY
jgi:hypothetical protein